MTGIYAGSFDPITNGHLDIIERASKLVDRLIVSVLNNEKKTSLFKVDERISHLEMVCTNMPNVEIDTFSGLAVDFAKLKNANVLIRGMRNAKDFDSEFEMYLNNLALDHKIENLYVFSKPENIHISSGNVKTILGFGGNVKTMVPDKMFSILNQKFSLNYEL